VGDIGKPVKHIEYEPLPETSPVEEPVYSPVEEPEKVPA